MTAINDIAIIWVDGHGDIQVKNEGVTTDQTLTNYVIISLFTDRAVDQSELEEEQTNRGWWGDSYSQSTWGSRLWLLNREKSLDSVCDRAVEWVGHSAGAEVVYMPLKIRPIDPVITLFPSDETIRQNVTQGLMAAINSVVNPSGLMPRSHLTQAISNAAGEYDHRLDYPPKEQDLIQAGQFELLTLGVITWR